MRKIVVTVLAAVCAAPVFSEPALKVQTNPPLEIKKSSEGSEARARIMELRRKLRSIEQKSANDPKYKDLKAAKDTAGVKYRESRDQAVASTPEGKAVIEEIAKLQTQMKELQKRMTVLIQKKRELSRSAIPAIPAGTGARTADAKPAEDKDTQPNQLAEMMKAYKEFETYKQELISKDPEGKKLQTELLLLQTQHMQQRGHKRPAPITPKPSIKIPKITPLKK